MRKRAAQVPEGLLSKTWSLVIVTLVTFLIWVLAESQTVLTISLEPEVAVAPGAADQIVRFAPDTVAESRALVSATEIRAEIRVQGSAAALDELRERLRGGVALTAGDEFQSGQEPLFAVDLGEALGRHEAFRNAAVTIVDTQPDIVRMQLDQLVTRRVRVSVAAPEGAFDGPPQPTPAELILTLPAGLAAELGESLPPAVVRVDPEALTEFAPGVPQTLTGLRAELPPDLAGRWGVRLEARPVSLALTLRSREAVLEIPSMPVQVVLAPSELDRWSITIPPGRQDLRDVRLVGPPEHIERVARALADPSSGDRPVAVVRLDFEELERGITSKPAEIIGLPRGVTAEVEDRVVRFEVRRREQPGGPAGTGAGTGAGAGG